MAESDIKKLGIEIQELETKMHGLEAQLTGQMTLFDFAAPESILTSLHDALFSYIMNVDINAMPENYKEVVSDFYYLTDFVQIAIEREGK